MRDAHAVLAPLAPQAARGALLTEDLLVGGGVIDAAGHFGRRFEDQHKLLCNFEGIQHTAQCAASGTVNTAPPPEWPGFEDVWIPIHDDLRLAGRLGLARDGDRVVRTDCVILLPGLLGDLHVVRTRNLAEALRAGGRHVLAVELRGCGQTDGEYPDVLHNFGVIETGDLRAVDEWLCARPEIDRTGVIGFCWGANIAILAAWDDARGEEDDAISPRLAPLLRPKSGARHFAAGVIAFSPCAAFERIIDSAERPWSKLENPILASLQDGLRERAVHKQHPDASGSLRRLIENEFARTTIQYPGGYDDGVRFLRLLPHGGHDPGDRLAGVRVPLLIVHGANDPLADPQAAIDLIARTPNPAVAGLILPGGGHVGFAAWSRAHFYGLILRFFDRELGAAARLSAAQPGER